MQWKFTLSPFLIVCVVIVNATACAQTRDVVSDDVIEALESEEAVSVMVMLAAPPSITDGKQDPNLMRREIVLLQDAVLATLSPSEFQLSVRYENVPAFAGRLFAAGVEKLKANPRVARVARDVGGSGSAVKEQQIKEQPE
jgi:hypothetical protein